MELNEFLSKFKEQYIDSESILLNADDNFRDIDSYDSLTGMAILVMIKDNFNIDITDEDYKNLHTVREVYNYIQDMKK
jgi:acyl carrier protein